jgi:hypothetical protein
MWINHIQFWQVGIGDPHAVVFHLPKKPEEKSNGLAAGVGIANTTVTIDAQLGVSDNLVRQILQQIRGYLIDNNVHIIDLAAKTLKVFVLCLKLYT